MPVELSDEELSEPDSTLFGIISFDDLKYKNKVTLNEVMIEVRRYIHEDIPRYTLIHFEEIDSIFSCHTKYYQGVLNYCLACAFAFLVCLVIIAIYLIVGVKFGADASPATIKIYRISLMALAILVLFFTSIALGGFFAVLFKWRQINSGFTNSGLASLAEYQKQITSIKDSVYREVDKYRATMTQLGLFDYVQKESSRIAYAIINAPRALYEKIKQTLKENVLYILDQIDAAKFPTEMVLLSIWWSIYILQAIKRGEIIFFCVGAVIIIWTTTVSGMLVYGTFKHCDTEMMSLCRLACCTLMLWWIVAALTVPMALTLADFCLETKEYGAEFVNFCARPLSIQLVYHYLTCEADNPLEEYLEYLRNMYNNMLKPLIRIFEKLKSIGLYENEDVLQKLRFTRDFLNETYLSGCMKSRYLYEKASYETCTYVMLGIVMVAFAAPCIGLILTVYVLVCLKLRNLVTHPENDTKEESETEDIYGPSPEKRFVGMLIVPAMVDPRLIEEYEEDEGYETICEPGCVGAETPDFKRSYHDEVCPPDLTIHQKQVKTACKCVQVKKKVCPAPSSGVCRILAKGDQPKPIKSCEDVPTPQRKKTASKVVQVNKKFCPAPGGVCRILERGEQHEPTKSCEKKHHARFFKLRRNFARRPAEYGG